MAIRSTRAVVADALLITVLYREPLLFCVVAAGVGVGACTGAGACTCTDGVPAVAADAAGTGT